MRGRPSSDERVFSEPKCGPAPVPGGLPTSADHPRSQEPTFSREASEEEQLVGWE